VIALAFAYGAFEAEIFRAGIQSISRGQMEAARSLGMRYFQAMRFVILPQAIRAVLPPLGNDFIAMLKDSSLATVLAVPELTQMTRVRRRSTFRVMEAFNVARSIPFDDAGALGRGAPARAQDEDRGIESRCLDGLDEPAADLQDHLHEFLNRET